MKKFIFAFIYIFCLMSLEAEASAGDISIFGKEEFNEVINSVDGILEEDNIDIKEMLINIVKGKQPLDAETLISSIKSALFGDINYVRQSIVHILIITIAAAILNNFANVFNNTQIEDISFYAVYTLLLTMLMKSFIQITDTGFAVIDKLNSFMRSLVPAYYIALSYTGNITSASLFYQVILVIIAVVDMLFFNLIIPLINIYVVLLLVNNLSKEDFLSRLAQLIKSAVEWLLKCMVTVVIGFNVLQGLIAPALDAFKTTALNKTVSAIPGVGNAVNAVTDMVIGSAVLVKNALGVSALIVLLIICIVPMAKLWIFSVMYRLSAAIIQPIADVRMVNCIGSIGDGAKLLIKVVTTALVLFIITIAIVTATTMP